MLLRTNQWQNLLIRYYVLLMTTCYPFICVCLPFPQRFQHAQKRATYFWYVFHIFLEYFTRKYLYTGWMVINGSASNA